MKRTKNISKHMITLLKLVGAFNPSEKYESQLGWFFPIYGKIKNVPNHQPENVIWILSVAPNGSPVYWEHSPGSSSKKPRKDLLWWLTLGMNYQVDPSSTWTMHGKWHSLIGKSSINGVFPMVNMSKYAWSSSYQILVLHWPNQPHSYHSNP